eukprot:TRINITY_DN30137_c0_g1_i1.p1 TRINITY_DN30137_c0_g1~~TRINITY_DN30137_c0_g1_i1.p1  ORF type:complete len:1191 (-),score=181.26 TRINITY_DN30137_c0_g1_i1:163-3735(-)
MGFKLPIISFALFGLGSCLFYDTPEDCSWSPMPNSDDSVFLTCKLSSINSRLERTNFSVIPSENTRGLKIVCTEPNLGKLEPSGFASLSLLEELVIDGCALESLPSDAFKGLFGLKKLSVITKNLSVLKVEADTFSHLSSLESLDLSENSIREFPSGEICKLTELTHLNLSSNEIGSTFDLSVQAPTASCLPHLKLLDLSNNEITSLESNTLPGWASLEDLRLQKNFIRFIAPDVFSNSSIKILDMSNNQINHLPPSLFHSIPLQSLSLANNTLSSLPTDVFHGQKQLEILDLSGNLLVSSQLTPTLTQDMFSLMEIDLGGNQIDNVQPDFLSTMPNLQALKLNGNKIQALKMSPDLFQLRNLDVSSNKLVKITADNFNGLESLTHLSLANNQIQTIHTATFRNASQILVLDISDNQLMSVPESLKYLTNLQTLDIGHNYISDINNSPFSVMEGLWRLQIHGNQIKNISHNIFSNLKTLQIIDMSRNEIASIDRGAFDQNKMLRAIRLDGNQVREIDGIFTHLPELIWLNVSDNKIKNFDYALVPRTLHWLDISHNEVQELGNYFDLSGDMALTYINAGFNKLTIVAPLNVPDSVETLLLNDNTISEVSPYTFFKKAKLVKVDLTVNEISGIAQTAIRLSSEIIDLPQFLLGGNPIICDCEMQWFKTVNDNNNIQRYPIIADLESIYCRLVYTTEQAFIPLVEARNDQFLCSYQTHCFSLCQCCQFDSCDCEMTCPTGCNCYHDNSWTKNIIQCSSNQFTNLPESMPMDATEIFLDGNLLDNLKSHTFIGRKNLRVLHLNNSRIDKIENQTFNGLKSLTVLHLENNNIRTLQGFEFSGLSHLRELYLQNNQITSIHNATFKALKSLEVLFLYGNTIVDYPVWQLAFNPYLVSIKIAENLWSCDCDFMQKFRGWLKVFNSKVYDAEQITCVSNEATGLNIRMTNYDISPCEQQGTAVAKNQVQDRDVKDYTPLMIATLASFALVILLAMVMFVFRHSIRVWIHSKYGVRMFESLESKMETGKLFDAYISYSPQDDVFVRQVLGNELEISSKYRVCLHHRDLPANTVVSDTVVRAAEAAQRAVIVLSQNFLKTEWSRFDYKSGLLQAVNNGNKKVIFVLLGNIESSLLDPNLRLLLKNNIVLQWGDSLFWEKMKYSLPDQQKAQPQAPSYSTYRPQPFQKNLTGQINAAMHM